MSVSVELSELDAVLWDAFKRGGEWVAANEYRKLVAENAKLRELVRNLWPFVKAGWVSACPNRECCLFDECDADSEYECLIEEHMAGRMRELGVWVTDGD